MSMEAGYDTLQLEMKTDGGQVMVELQEYYDNIVTQWQAMVVDKTG
jgi:hypothetical protein